MACFANRKQQPAEAPEPNPDVRELLTPNHQKQPAHLGWDRCAGHAPERIRVP